MKYVPCYLSLSVDLNLTPRRGERLVKMIKRSYLKCHHKFIPEKYSNERDFQMFGIPRGTAMTQAVSHFLLGPAKFSIVWRRKNNDK